MTETTFVNLKNDDSKNTTKVHIYNCENTNYGMCAINLADNNFLNVSGLLFTGHQVLLITGTFRIQRKSEKSPLC